jgi:hypothetical protein
LARTLAGAYAGAKTFAPAGVFIGGYFGPKCTAVGAFASGCAGAIFGGILGEAGVEQLAHDLMNQRPAWEPDDMALREQIAKDLISGDYDDRNDADAQQQLETALNKGHSPRQIADAVRTGLPGAIRDLYNELYFGDIPSHQPSGEPNQRQTDTPPCPSPVASNWPPSPDPHGTQKSNEAGGSLRSRLFRGTLLIASWRRTQM